MKTKLLYIFCVLFLSNLLLLSASSWDGNASISRYGELPSSGFYAATNSFEKNTLVEVVNKDNGRKTTVLVTDRLDDPGMFILLSPEAGEALGMRRNQIVRVEVSVAMSETETMAGTFDEPAFHPDPDINPTAAVTDIDSEIAEAREKDKAVETEIGLDADKTNSVLDSLSAFGSDLRTVIIPDMDI